MDITGCQPAPADASALFPGHQAAFCRGLRRTGLLSADAVFDRTWPRRDRPQLEQAIAVDRAT
jgi:hypothetical protein